MSDARDSLLARKYFDGIYIPCGLLVIGTIIVKREWAPYAVLVAIALGSMKYYNNRMPQSLVSLPRPTADDCSCHSPEEGPPARLIPGVRAQGEDCHLAQRRNVNSRSAPWNKPAANTSIPATASPFPLTTLSSDSPSASTSLSALRSSSPMALPRRSYVLIRPSRVTTSLATSTF